MDRLDRQIVSVIAGSQRQWTTGDVYAALRNDRLDYQDIFHRLKDLAADGRIRERPYVGMGARFWLSA